MYKVTTYLNDDRMPYLVKEEMAYKANKNDIFDDCDKVYELCKAIHMTERATEMVLLLIMDASCHLIAVQEVTTGSADRSILPVREIAQTMLLCGATRGIVVHNHPSGNTEPSDIDIAVTKKLTDALRQLDLCILDHLVVGREKYTSLKKEGMME